MEENVIVEIETLVDDSELSAEAVCACGCGMCFCIELPE